MKPDWLKAKIPSGKKFLDLKARVRALKLHTVCEEALCPNIGECWEKGSATVMILGDICTRSCGFCAVKTGRPLTVDLDEPKRVSEMISQMNLRHVVITSVDRDDLPDGGAGIFAQTIQLVKQRNPDMILEVLIPDFKAEHSSLRQVFEARPHVLNHNLETVRRLQKKVRPQASYERSLLVLKYAKEANLKNKSGLMLGLGETWDEILETLIDLYEQTRCDILTLGQYLSPSQSHLPIEKYYHPDEFEKLQKLAKKIGFRHVASGPFVRSSYHRATFF